jgi:NhaP-type Na+/H+ or K+/H+ antiporter
METLLLFLGLIIGGGIALGCFLGWVMERQLDKDE